MWVVPVFLVWVMPALHWVQALVGAGGAAQQAAGAGVSGVGAVLLTLNAGNLLGLGGLVYRAGGLVTEVRNLREQQAAQAAEIQNLQRLLYGHQQRS